MLSRSVQIPEGLDGLRADVGISKLLGFSRSKAAEIISAGGAKMSEIMLSKSDELHVGKYLEVIWQDEASIEIRPVFVPDFEIIYQDEAIVVISKPPGIAAHASLSWEGADVLSALAGAGVQVATSGAPERQGIVQRLDVGTSGLMVVAKSEHAYSVLKHAFRDRKVTKLYHALVQGRPDPLIGTIEAPIARHPKSDWKFTVATEGRHAVTHYRTLESHSYASLVELNLETGRTHQIRVHMAAQRHPCVGDPLYGSDPKLAQKLGIDRQWLHAKKLEFRHPASGKLVHFESEYYPDLAAALERLQNL